jgi:large subunit ribosomal protein L31e
MERLYTIPLRKEFRKAPNYKRTYRAIKAIRDFIQRHMKCDNVKIGTHLNIEMWKHGRKNPPPRIKVKAVKEKIKDKDKEIEYVIVELPHIKIEKPKKETKKKEKPKEEIVEVKSDEHKIEEEKEKHEVLQHEIHKETQPDMKIKPQKQKIKEKPMIIGRTSKK